MRRQFILCLMILLLVPIILAVDTEIKIKTMPNHEVQVTVAKASTSFSALYRYINNSDEYGDLSFVYPTGESYFNLYVYIKKDGATIMKDVSINYIAGQPVSLELAPSWFEFIETPEEEIENETIEDNSTLVEEKVVDEEPVEEVIEEETVVENSGGITGNAVSGDTWDFIPDNILYYVGGFFAFLFLILATVGVTKYSMRKEGSREKNIKITKLSEIKEEKKERIKDYKEVIDSAEAKIKEAQEEIRSLKEKGEISERQKRIDVAKKKLVEDEKELMKLRQGLKEEKAD